MITNCYLPDFKVYKCKPGMYTADVNINVVQ